MCRVMMRSDRENEDQWQKYHVAKAMYYLSCFPSPIYHHLPKYNEREKSRGIVFILVFLSRS